MTPRATQASFYNHANILRRALLARAEGGKEMKKGYKAVVESGSCSPDYKRWEERASCGHLHRTIEAAEKCGEKLRGSKYVNGSWQCSALWYNFQIHNEDGERIN